MRDEPGREATIRLRFFRENGKLLTTRATIAARRCADPSCDSIPTRRPRPAHAERQMRRVVEGSHQGVVVRTQDEVLFMNDGFARLIGYEDAETLMAIGQERINDFIHPDDRR